MQTWKFAFMMVSQMCMLKRDLTEGEALELIYKAS